MKRRKLAYEDEEGEDEEPQLLLTEHGEEHSKDRGVRLRARFDDADDSCSEEDEEEEDGNFLDEDTERDADDDDEDDMDLDGVDDSEINEELRDLQADNREFEDEPQAGNREFEDERFEEIDTTRDPASNKMTSREERSGRVDGIAALTKTFPSPNDLDEAEHDDSGDSEAESVSSMVKHYDQHGFPSGSILAGTASVQMAEALRKSGHPVKPPTHIRFDDDHEGTSDRRREEPVDPSRDSSSRRTRQSNSDSQPSPPLVKGISARDSESRGASSSGSDTDDGPEVASSKKPSISVPARLFGDDKSSLASDSDCDSEDNRSEDESISSGTDGVSDGDDESDDSSISTVSSEDLSDSSSESEGDDSDSDDDGEIRARPGSPSSDSENEEEDDLSSEMESSEEEDLSSEEESSDDNTSNSSSPSSAGKDAPAVDSPKRCVSNGQTVSSPTQKESLLQPGHETEKSILRSPSKDTTRQVPPGQGKTATQKRNARRRAALKAMKTALMGQRPPQLVDRLEDRSKSDSSAFAESLAAKKAALLQILDAPSGTHPHWGGNSADNKTGANQISQTTRTKDDEDTLRSTIMKDLRPLVNGHSLDSTEKQDNLAFNGQRGEEESEAWREKIVYRAVECCHDGVQLSEPPFPFVQRWDPQQQCFYKNNNQRGGRSKRKKRNQAEVLNEASSNKRRKCDEDGVGNDETLLNYDDEPLEAGNAADQSPNRSVRDEDLPPLPADISTLPVLEPNSAAPGMILTWKQWLLSKATNWQPQISNLTGIVVDVPDGSSLRVRLAKRDRNLDQNEKVYDDDGNRVYDKFELPGMDDDAEEAAEEGYRTLDVANMIEPRVLQPPPETTGTSSATLPAPRSSNDSTTPDTVQEARYHREADQPEVCSERSSSGSQHSAITEPNHGGAGPFPTGTTSSAGRFQSPRTDGAK